jgi:hypothetical protein
MVVSVRDLEKPCTTIVICGVPNKSPITYLNLAPSGMLCSCISMFNNKIKSFKKVFAYNYPNN